MRYTPITCPACGGCGGGPFGRAGSAWDVEGYKCPRCAGLGVISADRPATSGLARPLAKGPGRATPAPGLVQTRPVTERTEAIASARKKQ